MGQEFFINNQTLEDKVRQLLPSQGGAGAGFDLSASTQIIPIIDVTESAEGSNVRADLQTALSLTNVTSFSVNNTTTSLITTTGYFRVFGTVTNFAAVACRFQLTDGVTTKIIKSFNFTSGTNPIVESYDFVIFLSAGNSLQGESGSGSALLAGCTRQIADIDGNLVNPL
jgi:hypothetical protein